MLKIPIKSIGQTFSIKHIGEGLCDFDFSKNNIITFDNTIRKKIKKLFYKKTTLLSLYAIKEALKSANIDMETLDKNRIGLYTFEKESNNFCIKETYDKMIKLCCLTEDSENTFSDLIARCYSLSDFFRLMPNLSNHLISAELGVSGSNKTLLTGEGVDLQSIIDASNDIYNETYDMIICGSSALDYSVLEKKQMSLYYNYEIQEKEFKGAAIYLVLGKEADLGSLYFRGGRSFYIKKDFDDIKKKQYLHGLFENFYKTDASAKNDIDLIIYLDQYMVDSTKNEVEIIKEIFNNAKVIVPDMSSYKSINSGLFYLSLLYNNVYSFSNALLVQKNYNGIITFINITK